jgi:hypothetical protein
MNAEKRKNRRGKICAVKAMRGKETERFTVASGLICLKLSNFFGIKMQAHNS